MKKLFVVFFTILLLLSYAQAAEFWGSIHSNKYHYPDCKWAQKIASANLRKFNSTDEAIRLGYVPCKVCRPPVTSK